MLEFHDALRRVIEAASFLGSEEIALEEATGRALAEDVVTDLDLPPFEATAMDGWAVRTADVPSAPAVLSIAGAVGAGSAPHGVLKPGSALKVMTGASVPEGADAIVPVEDAAPVPQGVEIRVAPRPGAHIRRRGEVFAAGQSLLGAGRRLAPADLVLAAAAGRASLRVARRACTAVLVTGDEIVPPGSRPGPGQIRNTNGPLLLGALRRLGAEAANLGVARDEPHALRGALSRALSSGLDFLLTTGGVSAGDYDLVSGILSGLGAEILFHKVSIRPAKPVLFARAGKTLVFGLPGNPVSAAVAFDLFVRPAWRKASGLSPALAQPVVARLLGPVSNRGPRMAFLPAALTLRNGRLAADPIDSKGSHDVLAHAKASGYLVVSPATSYSSGDEISVYPATEETTVGAR